MIRGPIGACLALGLLAGCPGEEGTKSEQAAPPPAAVGVVAVTRKNVAVGADFVGRVVAVHAVDIRARVTGFLEKTHFADGQEVRESDPLFVIEKATYEAQLAQARADVARAEAEAANAGFQLQRALELVKNHNIPEATVDQRRAEDAVAKASLLQRRAATRQSEINLGYTEIHSPIAGRIGRALYSDGSFVGPDSGPLATVVSQDPMHVTFPVSQREIMAFKRRVAEHPGEAGRVVVRIRLSDNSVYAHPGRVDFLDVSVDQQTDTLTVRAEVPNPERLLVDGQFVSVLAEQEQPESALTVPQAAIQADQAGTFVLVVGSDRKVEMRRITLGEGHSSGDAVVQQGLGPGEVVIVQGIQKVRPGQVVEPSPMTQQSGA